MTAAAAIKLYIPPGVHYMDGGEALAYSRSRHTTSDFDRSARQMRMITALRNQIDIPSLLGRHEAAPGHHQEGHPDGHPVQAAADSSPSSPRASTWTSASRSQLTHRQVQHAVPAGAHRTRSACSQGNGLYALVANVPAMRKAVAERVHAPTPRPSSASRRSTAKAAVVHVLNGTKGSNLKTTKLADYLANIGLDSTVPPVNAGKADRDDYTDTVITAYNGAAAGHADHAQDPREGARRRRPCPSTTQPRPRTSWSSWASRHRSHRAADGAGGRTGPRPTPAARISRRASASSE